MGHDPRAAISRKIQREMERRTIRALKEKHEQFRIDHENDTDKQLLDYLRACAQDLGYSPAYGEIIGYPYIRERFGHWAVALKRAGLEPNNSPKEHSKKTKMFKQELKRQHELRKLEDSKSGSES